MLAWPVKQVTKGKRMKTRCRRRRHEVLIALGVLAAGLATYAPEASAQVQSPTTTTLTASPSSAATGQQVTLSAHVSGCPDPTTSIGMSFFDGGNLLQTAPIDTNGDASLTISFSSAGTHTIEAVFNASTECGVSSDTKNVDVTSSPTPPTLPNLIGLHIGDIKIGNTQNIIDSYNKSIAIYSHNVVKIIKSRNAKNK